MSRNPAVSVLTTHTVGGATAETSEAIAADRRRSAAGAITLVEAAVDGARAPPVRAAGPVAAVEAAGVAAALVVEASAAEA
jgi:hypothetical protein